MLSNTEREESESAVDLYATLVALAGRRLSMQEVYEAVGLSSPQFYEARKQGKLCRADRLIKAATHLGINPVALLVRCGVIELGDVVSFTEQCRRAAAQFHEACEPAQL